MASTPSNTTDLGRKGNNTEKTPYQTPNRRGISAVHTPLDRTGPRNLLNSVRRGTSASGGKKNNAPTPHAKAARRALDDRRTAMFTPGKRRRQSQIHQRETPRNILLDLGKALAPTSKAISSSSSSPNDETQRTKVLPVREEQENRSYYDDLDDELPIDRPRLSLPIDQDDDDDEEELRPPRLSEVQDYTVQSIELPRRINNEQPGRLSRGSFGSLPLSDAFNPDEATGIVGRESDFFPGLLQDLQERAADEGDLERIEDDLTRRSTLGRQSDFGLEMPIVEDQTTFVLSEPALDQPPPDNEPSVIEAFGDDAAAPMDDYGDVSDRELLEDFGDRESIEDIPSGSEEGGVEVMNDGFSDRGGDDDANVTATITQLEEPTREVETRRADLRVLKKRKLISQHGIEYPSLPPAFVKRVAQTALQSSGLSNKRISTDTLAALTQASEWYFEQLGDDLGAYAHHAKRKTIEESDVATLMRRQRLVGSSATMFSLAQKHLPGELLQELRMPLPQLAKKRRAKRPRDEEGNDDDT